MQLREIAHARAGDKGDVSNISVMVFNARDYALLEQSVTAQRVKAHFGDIVAGDVVRYELASLGALNFVMYGALDGGVTSSIALDAHGKSLSSALLSMEISDRVILNEPG